jgi:hypothetical protein
MGRQKPGKLLDLITECVVSEDGILYDEPTGIALMMRMNANLLNSTPVLNLTYGVDVSPPLTKVIDDVDVANDITVTNWDGTEVRVEQTSGALSTAAPPSGVGRYKRPLAVNLLSVDQMVDRGSWELAKGTLDRPRYQSVVVNLLAFPSYRSTVNAMRPGDWITVSGFEADTIYLMVVQIQRGGDAAQDTATLKCVPAEVFQVLRAETAGYLAGSASTTLGAGATSTATSLTFSTVSVRDVWSTTSEPYDVLVAGERMTVTNMTSASGTGPYTQTATVTRSVNGIVKAQLSNAAVQIFQPKRFGK